MLKAFVFRPKGRVSGWVRMFVCSLVGRLIEWWMCIYAVHLDSEFRMKHSNDFSLWVKINLWSKPKAARQNTQIGRNNANDESENLIKKMLFSHVLKLLRDVEPNEKVNWTRVVQVVNSKRWAPIDFHVSTWKAACFELAFRATTWKAEPKCRPYEPSASTW